jgi:hypothetical protein
VKLVPTFSDIISGFEKFPEAMDNFIHAVTRFMHIIRIPVLHLASLCVPQMMRDPMILGA